MLVGLSVAGLAVFVLALRAVLRSGPIDRKAAGLRAANRVPLADDPKRPQLRVVDRG